MLTRVDELREPVALDTQLSLRPARALNYYNHLRPVEGLAVARTRLPVPGLRGSSRQTPPLLSLRLVHLLGKIRGDSDLVGLGGLEPRTSSLSVVGPWWREVATKR